jgi:5-methylcytosine-specific restriction endonuclease McrA
VGCLEQYKEQLMLRGPMLDEVVVRLYQAAAQAIALDLDSATSSARLIDAQERRDERRTSHDYVRQLLKERQQKVVAVKSDKRSNPSPKIRLAIYARDQYTCRYAHCQRATVDERVVAALSRLIPEALPYERHWPDNSTHRTHPLLWTHLASLEHVVAWAAGGTNSQDNLITACSRCNYTKNKASADQLGWEVLPPADHVWDGLVSFLPGLERAYADLAAHHGE